MHIYADTDGELYFTKNIHIRKLIAGAATGDPNFISLSAVKAAMSAAESRRYVELTSKRSELGALLEDLEKQPVSESGWVDLGHAIFNLKEFLYLR